MTTETIYNTQTTDSSDLTDTFVYEVDHDNKIRRTSSCQTNECLGSNDSEVSPDILFESIFSDSQTRMVFFRLLEHARETNDAVSFPYRCDTRDTCNFYRLTISISTSRCVLFFNKLLGVDHRPSGVSWNRISSRSLDAVPVCSICNRAQFDQRWYYFQELVNLDLWPADNKDMLCTSTVCQMCESGITQRIRQSSCA